MPCALNISKKRWLNDDTMSVISVPVRLVVGSGVQAPILPYKHMPLNAFGYKVH